jgi:hypothetical protein
VTNERLLERGIEPGSSQERGLAGLYATYCRYPDDTQPKVRVLWRTTRLCNSADLKGDILEAAVAEFHGRVDEEITRYRLSVMKNVTDKMGKPLLAAFGLIAAVAAGIWVARGRLI